MQEGVSKTEYNAHRDKCGQSFDLIFKQLEQQNRALFGEKEMKEIGLVEMTKEMYKTVIIAKGGRMLLLQIAGLVVTLTGAFWAIVELFKRVRIN